MKSAELQRYTSNQMSAYREGSLTGECEVSYLLRKCEQFRRWEDNNCFPTMELHHIAGRQGMMKQSFCNLILVSGAAHSFGHFCPCREFNANHAMEACCWFAKLEMHEKQPMHLRSMDQGRQHWDVDILNRICGHSTFEYRCEWLVESLVGSPFESLAAELLEKVQ